MHLPGRVLRIAERTEPPTGFFLPAWLPALARSLAAPRGGTDPARCFDCPVDPPGSC
jgi:hypothetical protein